MIEFYEEEVGSEVSYGSESESGEEEQSEVSDEEASSSEPKVVGSAAMSEAQMNSLESTERLQTDEDLGLLPSQESKIMSAS